MYKAFIIFVLISIGFLFWKLGPGNNVTYYENRSTTHTESTIIKNK